MSSSWTEEGEELVVARSLGEQVILAVICLVLGLISVGGNAATLLVTWRHRALHTPYMACVACMAIADIITSVSFNFPVSFFYATGYSLEMTRLGCWVFRFLRILGLMLSIHLLSLLALERYTFFLHPLRYCVLCSKRSMAAAFAFVTCIATATTSMGYLFGTYKFYSIIGCCQLIQNNLNTALLMVTSMLPNILIQPFVIIRITLMLRRTRCEVTAASPNSSSPSATLALNLSSSLRVIMLTSGLFWVTYVPSGMLIWVLRQHDYSPELMEMQPFHYIAYIFRVNNIGIYSLPPVFNPFVHLYVNKELRSFMMTDMRAVRDRLRVCMRQTRSRCIHRVAPEEVHSLNTPTP